MQELLRVLQKSVKRWVYNMSIEDGVHDIQSKTDSQLLTLTFVTECLMCLFGTVTMP